MPSQRQLVTTAEVSDTVAEPSAISGGFVYLGSSALLPGSTPHVDGFSASPIIKDAPAAPEVALLTPPDTPPDKLPWAPRLVFAQLSKEAIIAAIWSNACSHWAPIHISTPADLALPVPDSSDPPASFLPENQFMPGILPRDHWVEPWADQFVDHHSAFECEEWNHRLVGDEITRNQAEHMEPKDQVKMWVQVQQTDVIMKVAKIFHIRGAIENFIRKDESNPDGLCSIIFRFKHGAHEVPLDPEMWHQILRNTSRHNFREFQQFWRDHRPQPGSVHYRQCRLCLMEQGEIPASAMPYDHFTVWPEAIAFHERREKMLRVYREDLEAAITGDHSGVDHW